MTQPTYLTGLMTTGSSGSTGWRPESIIQLATSDAVVDRLLQRLAQRVDGDLPAGAMPPPEYPGSADAHR